MQEVLLTQIHELLLLWVSIILDILSFWKYLVNNLIFRSLSVGPPVGCYHRTADTQQHFPSQRLLGYSKFLQPGENLRLYQAEVTAEPRVRFVVGLARQPDTSALQPGVAGDLLQGQPRTGLPLQNTWRSERERERG